MVVLGFPEIILGSVPFLIIGGTHTSVSLCLLRITFKIIVNIPRICENGFLCQGYFPSSVDLLNSDITLTLRWELR